MRILRKLIFYYWYLRIPPWDTNQTPPEVQEFIKNNPPGRALDLGCGTGTTAITLAQNGWQVVGIDFVGKAIRVAKQKAYQVGVDINFRVDDVTRFSGIDGPFDLILDIGCYHNLDPKGMEAYRSKINNLLGKGGMFLLYAFFRDGDSKSGNGITEADLNAFSPTLTLTNRADGWGRGARPSAWLAFRKDEV